jgi:CO/xanthine dehydrogenase Mo-binding subunit
MTTPANFSLSRRALLASGGALVVAFSLSPQTMAQEGGAASAPKGPPLPGDLKDSPKIDSWIRIDASGKITVLTGKAELGQGAKTSLSQIAAEQLVVPFDAVSIITADTEQTPNEGYTAGSQTIQYSGTAILHAAAQAREILIKVAAERLSVDAAELKAEGGAVIAPDGRKLGYGELVAGDVLKVDAEPKSKLIDPATYKTMGKSVPRIDIPGKVTGQAAFVQDMRLPGMLHARIVRPPSYKAELQSVDTAAVEKLPGVRKVVRDGNYLAVVAEKEFQAIKALEALTATAKWAERESLPPAQSFYDWLKQQKKDAIVVRDDKADASPAVRTLEAEYHRPYQMHGSIGPSCAVAQYVDGKMTVWSHGQGMFPLRQAVAQLLKLPQEAVHCIHAEGAGCYGHNGADDAGADAAFIAYNMPGVPIRVQLMRHDEHMWEPYGSGMAMTVKAGLDSSGSIVSWNFEVFTDTHSMRPGGAGNTLVGQHKSSPFKPSTPRPSPQPNGSGDRNIVPIYKIPNLRLVHNFQPHMQIRVSALRGLGAYANVFAIESFMDELAAAAKVDPVEFRLKHLADNRAIDVVKMVAEKVGWKSGGNVAPGRAMGFGFARYKSTAAYCAVAVELAVEHETGRIRLIRAVSACDGGNAVNPDGIANQIEGGIIQATSWTLNEAVQYDGTRILSRDWSRYPILRFRDLYEQVDVHVINRPNAPFLGCGEASQGPTGAAIANAVATATGKRIRALPYTARNVKDAIGV